MKYSMYEVFIRYKIPILIVLVSEVIILFFLGRVSVYLFPQSRAAVLNIWELWNVWDAPHYISVASSGYQKLGVEANFIVFLPLLPLLIFLSKSLFHTNFLTAGYIVSSVTSFLLAFMLYKLTLLDYPKKIANWTVFFLFTFPTAFFLYIPYTESLFLFLSVSAFYFVRKRNYWISLFFVSLASSTRIVGLVLIPAVFTEILFLGKESFKQMDTLRKFCILFFGLLLSLSGFFIYLLLNYFILGDPLHFTLTEKQNWHTTFSPFGQGLISAFQSLSWRVDLQRIMLGYGQIIAFFFGLIMSIYVLIKIRFSYGLYMLLVLWSSFAMSFWLSMPRYILSLFPMFIVLALFSKRLVFRYFWILISTVLLIIFSLIFIQYGPVL